MSNLICSACSKDCTNLSMTKGLCKACYRKQWERDNVEYMRAYRRNYYHSKEDKAALQQKIQAKRKTEHGRKLRAEQQRKREARDPAFKMKRRLRKRLYNIVKGGQSISLSKSLGCSSEELKRHIESLWQPGMTWDTYGTNGWELDHIKPLCSAATTQELELLSHYSNLQPLWRDDNCKKSHEDRLLKTDLIEE